MSITAIQRTVYVGTFIHSASLTELEVLENAAVSVDGGTGTILEIEKTVTGEMVKLWEGDVRTKIVRAGEGQFFFPGFIGMASFLYVGITYSNPTTDTHIHASQYPNSGIFGTSTLLDWLNRYTFPLEASLSNPSKARTVYTRCVSRTLSHGTTTAAYYATRDVTSTNILASVCFSAGQRAFVGRCCMDCLSPDNYRDESPAQAIADTKACAAYIGELDPTHALVTPIITPRFAPSCSRELLAGLGAYMAESGLPCQTHISENKAEIAFVAELFPEHDSYASVYDAYGLLQPKTVLAHAIHLSDAEIALVKSTGAKVSHCPISNAALTSGAARVRRLLNEGIVVGLGTDVSGGYSPSILEAARQATMTSRFVALTDGDDSKLSVEEALYLATRGGAEVLGLESKVGAFELGMEWDAILIGLTNVPEVDEERELGRVGERVSDVVGGGMGPVDVFGWENWSEKVAKWMYCGDDRNVLSVWVKGKVVHKKPE